MKNNKIHLEALEALQELKMEEIDSLQAIFTCC